VRAMGQYSTEALSDDDLTVVLSRAKRHLLSEADLSNPDWYEVRINEEALFWTALLFSKVQTGALDAKSITDGEITEGALLANQNEQVTTWYRQYSKSKDKLIEENRTRGEDGSSSRHRQIDRTTIEGSRYYTRRE
jgi:hypothetical protein